MNPSRELRFFRSKYIGKDQRRRLLPAAAARALSATRRRPDKNFALPQTLELSCARLFVSAAGRNIPLDLHSDIAA